jgi:hypothetical protein
MRGIGRWMRRSARRQIRRLADRLRSASFSRKREKAAERGRRFDDVECIVYDQSAGWSSLVARWAHNPKVGGSNPPPATKNSYKIKEIKREPTSAPLFFAQLCANYFGETLAGVPVVLSWERREVSAVVDVEIRLSAIWRALLPRHCSVLQSFPFPTSNRQF